MTAIIGVSVTDTIDDVDFTPGDVTFDANNIFVDLNDVTVFPQDSIIIDVTFNDPPTAAADTAATAFVTPVVIDVFKNDDDLDGTLDRSSVTITDGPANGTATVNPDGTVTYLPDFLFLGTDGFTYTVADDQGDASNEATVEITVGSELNPIDGQGSIAGTPDADAITAGTGAFGRGATVFAQGGSDTILGSAGNDSVFAGTGNDSVFAGTGNDLVFGGRGSDRLLGEAGDDILVDGPGNDTLLGGSGLDTAVCAGLFADHRITGFGTQSRTVEDLAGNGGRDSLNLVELLQFDDGVFDTRNGSFSEGAFATPEVEQLVTSPGFTTSPDGFATGPSTAQVESLVVQAETV